MQAPLYTQDEGRLAALDAYRILDTPAEQNFDDIVALARHICHTPVALVSFVAIDRQWFKARVGFDGCQTDLASSVCAHALIEPDLLVIGDLTADPRTRYNPLVTADPHIRFYAGAPLRLADGTVLGSLCVIDTVPRPSGLTPDQSDALRALGRQVVALLELRKSLRTQEEDELRYKTMFDAVASGVCIIELKFEGDRAVDYRFIDVNRAFEQQTGLKNAKGRWIRELAPSLEQYWFDIYGRVARTGEAVSFENEAAALGRHYIADAIRIGDPKLQHVAVLFQDITERRNMEVTTRESQERLQLALSAGRGIGTWDWDVQADRVTADPLFARLYGIDPKAAAEGAPIASFFGNVYSDDLPALRKDIEAALETGNIFAAEYRLVQPDSTVIWVAASGRATLLPDGTASRFPGVSYNITDRRQADERRMAMLRLNDVLRDTADRGVVLTVAAQVLVETLNAARAGFAGIDLRENSMTVQHDLSRDGATLAGKHSLSGLTCTLAYLRTNDILVVPNIPSVHWLKNDSETYAALGVKSLVNVPFKKGSDLLGIMFVHGRSARTWTNEEVSFVQDVADRTFAAIGKIEAEDHQKTLNQELSHRLKNTLAMVQAIAKQTLRAVPEREPVVAFEKRIFALASAHEVLLQQSWTAAAIAEVVSSVLGLFDGLERFEFSGPQIKIGPRATLSLSLLLHELMTNALKYGSLSVPEGRVRVAWRVEHGNLVLDWTERGGPSAVEPVRRGFGSRLIKMGLLGTGGSDQRYLQSGLVATFSAPLSQILQN